MNKWLVFPLIIMIVIMSCAIIIGDSSLAANAPGSSSTGTITVNGASTTINTPSSNSYNLQSTNDILGILALAIAAGAIAGFHLLGSGVSTLSQELTIKSIAYIGIWAAMTFISSNYFIALPIFGPLLYIILTICFVIGFIADIRSGAT